MSSEEFTDWMAYAQIEPFGEGMANWRAGMLASVLANLKAGKSGRTYTPEDFMPVDPAERPSSGWAAQLAHVRMLAARGLGTLTTRAKGKGKT